MGEPSPRRTARLRAAFVPGGRGVRYKGGRKRTAGLRNVRGFDEAPAPPWLARARTRAPPAGTVSRQRTACRSECGGTRRNDECVEQGCASRGPQDHDHGWSARCMPARAQFWQGPLGLCRRGLENRAVHRRLIGVNRSHHSHRMTAPARITRAGRSGVVPAAGAGTHPWPTALSPARRFTPLPR